jgi:natural product biosynthesis luciferase-like monooxygenase protein
MDVSLFHFAADARRTDGERYRLLIEGAKFADRNGFAAVWTPERHFHRFGGDYPNPAITAAALATVTHRVALRAGSVVAPLHHVLEVAEDWAVVDNLSHGRAGLSLASGWNPRDFILRPTPGRADWDAAATVAELRKLWRGEPYRIGETSETGAPSSDILVYPPPTRELPLWITASGNIETFRTAGRCGAGVLTHLASQSLAELRMKVAAYREQYAASGCADAGHVVLMLHTYLDRDRAYARARATGPLENYLIDALDLFRPPPNGGTPLSPVRARLAVRSSLDRYLHGGAGLFGSVDDVMPLLEEFHAAGVDEIACLIDFGIPSDMVLSGLEHLAVLAARAAELTHRIDPRKACM